jgi:hypothetical protein
MSKSKEIMSRDSVFLGQDLKPRPLGNYGLLSTLQRRQGVRWNTRRFCGAGKLEAYDSGLPKAIHIQVLPAGKNLEKKGTVFSLEFRKHRTYLPQQVQEIVLKTELHIDSTEFPV